MDGLPTMAELNERRLRACRLMSDRALQSLDEAAAFADNRGLLTLMPDCALPSLFAAAHEEALRPGGRGFSAWPRTKWRWAGELRAHPGLLFLRIHRGKGLFVSRAVAALVDPLARAALAAAEAGEQGQEAQRLVRHLAMAGPGILEEVKAQLGFEARTLHRLRDRLECLGGLVSRGVPVSTRRGGTREVTELVRWDQLFPAPPSPEAGGLEKLVVAGVRAAVLAPESELNAWFSWPVAPDAIERLVHAGRLFRPGTGWLAAAP